MTEDQRDQERTEDDMLAAAEKEAKALLERYKRQLPEILGQWRAERSDFQRQLVAHWGSAFDLYDACYRLAFFAGHGINERHRAAAYARQDRVYEVLARLHSSACLTASEVRALVFTGHGGGALAVSRKALELAVIGTFVRERGQDVAERYVKHATYERLKWAEEYDAAATALGEQPHDPTELWRLRERCAELEREYGKNYLSDYGWAAGTLKPDKPNYRPTLKDIEEATDLKRLRHFYRHVSQRLHAGATGSAAHFYPTPQGGAYNTGPSDTGLALPASATLRALAHCTSVFAMHELNAYKDHGRPVVQFMALSRLTKEANAAFNAIEENLAAAQRSQGPGTA